MSEDDTTPQIDPETGHYRECPAPEDFKGETACYCDTIEARGR